MIYLDHNATMAARELTLPEIRTPIELGGQ